MSNFKIFIVEDDPWYGEILSYHLGHNPEYELSLFKTGKDCLSNIHLMPDLITIDFMLPDTTGDKLISSIKKTYSNVPIIILSSQEDIKIVVQLMKMGISDYIVKDENAKELLWNSILRIRETTNLQREVAILREELGHKYNFEKTIIGQSNSIRKIFTLMQKAAQSNINVTITGETGTGKELVAKAIHFNSERKNKPFVAINMGAIPKELIESELFGHEKGAFTGAFVRKIGKFEEANGGTIFLDEIAELDLNVQSKILRVLQERELVRVGGNIAIPLDIRIISATHKDLNEEVSSERFREDLYFRLIGLPIQIPALRERDNDILVLTKYFLDLFKKENNLADIKLTEGASKKLMNYSFPGNVRELKATIDIAAILCQDNVIEEKDISFLSMNKEKLFIKKNKSLKQYTQDIILHYLEGNNGDVIKTANDLDIGKSTIYKMLKEQS